MKTESEKIFEEYLDSNGFQGKWKYEPLIPGKSKKPDYMVAYDEQECFFEVKELHRKQNEPTGAAFINPYEGLRVKIHEVRKQFKEHKEFACSLVVYNVNDRQARLGPQFVFASMLGNLGITMDFDSKAGRVIPETSSNTFLGGGKMIDYKRMQAQNTTISAIIVLEKFLDNVEREKALVRLEQERGSRITGPELVDTVMELQKTYPSTNVPRVIVVENPYARIPLPDGIFEGMFDERWKSIKEQNGRIARVYVGERIKELESLRETQGRLKPSIE